MLTCIDVNFIFESLRLGLSSGANILQIADVALRVVFLLFLPHFQLLFRLVPAVALTLETSEVSVISFSQPKQLSFVPRSSRYRRLNLQPGLHCYYNDNNNLLSFFSLFRFPVSIHFLALPQVLVNLLSLKIQKTVLLFVIFSKFS